MALVMEYEDFIKLELDEQIEFCDNDGILLNDPYAVDFTDEEIEAIAEAMYWDEAVAEMLEENYNLYDWA